MAMQTRNAADDSECFLGLCDGSGLTIEEDDDGDFVERVCACRRS